MRINERPHERWLWLWPRTLQGVWRRASWACRPAEQHARTCCRQRRLLFSADQQLHQPHRLAVAAQRGAGELQRARRPRQPAACAKGGNGNTVRVVGVGRSRARQGAHHKTRQRRGARALRQSTAQLGHDHFVHAAWRALGAAGDSLARYCLGRGCCCCCGRRLHQHGRHRGGVAGVLRAQRGGAPVCSCGVVVVAAGEEEAREAASRRPGAGFLAGRASRPAKRQNRLPGTLPAV